MRASQPTVPSPAARRSQCYASEAYAAAFGPPYRPCAVPEWGTSVLLRPIGESGREDAMSCYPRTVLSPEPRLADGLARLKDAGAVSVTLALDPLSVSPGLAEVFHVARPFKTHFIVDRQQGAPQFSKHHRYKIRRATRASSSHKVSLANHLARWVELYAALVVRHDIVGIQRFSNEYFAALAALPGLSTYAAVIDQHIVAMSLWLREGEHAHFHLAAADDEGYRAEATYLLHAAAIEDLRDCRWLDLGGTAGTGDDASSGLARFKRGFANTTADAWLCGHVLDESAYRALSRELPATTYFPAYRQPGQLSQRRASDPTIRSTSDSARSG
jgi:GNAT acetyltransferase-like protein